CITGGLGMLLLVTKVLLLCKFMERKKEIKLKQKLFKRNGVKLIYEGKVNKLINEVVILSQINLETEVLLLVYEFISNGTVYQYINNQNEEFPIAWEMQLHIVVDSLADQTYMTTQVQGTFGYLDLQYFQSSPFTEKSNLLTKEKPICLTTYEENKSLTTYFLRAMKEDRLFEIFDGLVLKEGGKDEIVVVVKLKKRCLNLNEKKPTMR
ncbi:hypothetical protein CISIN_1g048710mg, partial [Citrus sinensis]